VTFNIGLANLSIVDDHFGVFTGIYRVVVLVLFPKLKFALKPKIASLDELRLF
jgi:hypothetical protein